MFWHLENPKSVFNFVPSITYEWQEVKPLAKPLAVFLYPIGNDIASYPRVER